MLTAAVRRPRSKQRQRLAFELAAIPAAGIHFQQIVPTPIHPPRPSRCWCVRRLSSCSKKNCPSFDNSVKLNHRMAVTSASIDSRQVFSGPVYRRRGGRRYEDKASDSCALSCFTIKRCRLSCGRCSHRVLPACGRCWCGSRTTSFCSPQRPWARLSAPKISSVSITSGTPPSAWGLMQNVPDGCQRHLTPGERRCSLLIGKASHPQARSGYRRR